MDLELFIHGVPNGHKINGVSGDNTYFTTFYNPSKKEFQGAPKFLIEIRNLNGTNYIRNTKLELWFLGKLKSENDLRVLRDEILTSGINDVKLTRQIDNSIIEKSEIRL